MSLLIDALKRAENVKRGQTEPQLAQPGADSATGTEAKPPDWALTEPVSDPTVSETTPVLPEAPSRTEPKFFQTVTEPPPVKPSSPGLPASKTTGSSSALASDRVTKEREAAQTLFQAKRPAPRSRAGILLVGGLAALLLAAGGFYVWYSFEFPPSPPFQPTQARTPAPPVSPAPAPSAPDVKPPVTAAPEIKSVADVPPEPPSPAIATVSQAAAANASEQEKSPPKTKRPRRSASRVSAAEVENLSAAELSTEDTVQREIEQARQPRGSKSRRSAKNNRAISVSQSERGSSDFDPDLAIAYNSLLSGQRAEAKRLYSIVAERDPFNVDALLGLATIAADQGDLTGAERYYRRALELEPQQAAALAGLASMQQPGGPSESQIKSELARTPDSPQLHFALGNQYANQSRWDEAQQAYFDAFSLDAGNPDYAYNLAVSLDQLGQTKPATTYYRKALDLAKNRSARFRSADVALRLSELAAP